MKNMKKKALLCLVVTSALVAWLVTYLGHRPDISAQEPKRSEGTDLGLGVAFDAELKKVGQITPDEFGKRFHVKSTTAKFSWDPTKAAFFDRFSVNPTEKGAKTRARGDEERWVRERAKAEGKPIPDDEPVWVPLHGGFDFRLNEKELAKFKENGFVVSERLGSDSFTNTFYHLYQRDLPVFISSDAVLHAWHRTYDALLEEIETEMLIPALDDLLVGMSAKIPKAMSEYGEGQWRQSLVDADYFLTVARSLLKGTTFKTRLGEDERVAVTLKACESLGLQKFELFGSIRDVDFSQFKPRGHYENSDALKRYFKAMMWCGRIDMRVAGDGKVEEFPRQLASAMVLHDLLQRSGDMELWRKFDSMIQTFVGKSDSLTFAQLDAVLASAKVRSPADAREDRVLHDIQNRIATGDFVSEIRGDVFVIDPSSPKKFVLPHSFCFLGQRFVLDSWVTSKVTYPDVIWDGAKLQRRVPSCLDVSFAALKNDHAASLLVDRITNPDGRKFRDGLNYQHNLTALRNVMDNLPEAAWKENLYTGWLGTLRELSKPTTDEKYPEVMRNRAWGMKTLNTQHASWSQLRHDTILYVKQSYTAVPGCYYPAGFVEPIPHFWANMEQMATRAAKLIEASPYPNLNVRERQAKFLHGFASKMTTLRFIAEKELAQKELTKEETKFLEDVIAIRHERFGSGGIVIYEGWYPSLFYLGSDDSLKWDAIVADVHTNPPAPLVGDPGCVLHQGVGSVDFLLIAIDNGKDRMVYGGPVLSHYEFEMPGVTRKADSEWQRELREGRVPPRPEWTHGYMVPKDPVSPKR